MQDKEYTAAGLRYWAPEEIGSRISPLEGTLPDLSAIWVFCPPEKEGGAWSELLPRLGQEEMFLWTAAMHTQHTDTFDSGSGHHGIIAQRTLKRLDDRRFPMFPHIESTFSRRETSQNTARDFISGLSARGSGYAVALGFSSAQSTDWLQASVAMESHFSLHRDFDNTLESESIRRGIVSLYVRSSVALGFLPLIPLNKHPEAGFTIFCHPDQYDEILTNLADACEKLEGDAAVERISRFIGLAGDLAYL
ncbi:hypothetical protein KV205_01800 [Streptomyces sp. SKN60]|uniref:hypothetical protein n=1 Tax=Streptomyces sp. SKN60 TaxID=2855506 RepID=UPI0022473D0E|nr:hypothetical protein [Streptomyces sp. SKN60]MCX2179266.1 hypothetical protein [Streptomyces sp. SKN60]